MNIISQKEMTNGENKVITYELDDTIRRDTIEIIVKGFENERTKMDSCHVSTYSDSESVSECTFYDSNELEQLNKFPSPYMSFTIDYVDRLSNEYRFTLETSSNNNKIKFIIDKKKQQLEQARNNGRSKH